MTNLILNFVCLIAGYLLGSVNTSIVVGKLYDKDVRNYGSKGAGLTNVLRVLGKKAALIVLIGDILKGVLACLIGSKLGYFYQGDMTNYVGALITGVGAVMGHNWPLYFNFKGGKGALIAISVMFMVNWPMALISIIFFVLVVAITRYVSLGTVGATILFVIISYLPFFNESLNFHIISSLLAIVIIFRHRANIQRLINGTENKLSFSK
ncbi:MAG TPA: glycerol-3-phosphate 1-O-acyltransferase PlsY [Rickettsiales bacterium]|nr:glycerol-3-phosphate 1-O-acyltransferase PlsY [Rickettsiales bacterium]